MRMLGLNETINRLVKIGETVSNESSSVKNSNPAVKSQAVLDEMHRLFEYALEIVGLAKHNDRYAKTNAVLLRVLLEVWVKIHLINRHISKHEDPEEQEKIIIAFEKRFFEEWSRQRERRKESLKEMRNTPQITEEELSDIQSTIKRIEENEREISNLEKKYGNRVSGEELPKLVPKDIYKRIECAFHNNKEYLYKLGVFYQNCSRYIHPNHILSEEKEVSKDLYEITCCFASIVDEFNNISRRLGDEDKEFLLDVVRQPQTRQ